ncbi:WPE palindromic element domain-containing protein [Wolbachia endosymbiont (group A) of Cheilosia soror]|uniref:WPE palindromic element domain-containing protein n=1 Tax=Wolbachia endosymbiont (group A) of Cheilosia soror TaxID=2953995 RepID=UPI0021F906FB|nr:WPE palindromic element domain-containing protein [Wolbachia endosymbiont (group A) of Cheilosia soror]
MPQRQRQCLDYLDPEKLIVHYTTFSIKSWIPVSSTGMTGEGCWDNKERNTGMTKIGTEMIEKEHLWNMATKAYTLQYCLI